MTCCVSGFNSLQLLVTHSTSLYSRYEDINLLLVYSVFFPSNVCVILRISTAQLACDLSVDIQDMYM